MNTSSRFLWIVWLCIAGQPAAEAQITQRCPGNFGNADDLRLAHLETKFDARLAQHAVQTGVAAFAAYDKFAAIQPVQRLRPALFDRICRDEPQLCKPDGRDLCAAIPGACRQAIYWEAPPTLDELLAAAQTAARAAIDGSNPLGPRAALLARVTAIQALSGLPGSTRQAIGEHALALELQAEGQKLTAEFEASLVHQSCAHSFVFNYPFMVEDPPTAATMDTQLENADAGLSDFGLPGDDVRYVLTGDAHENAAFFEAYLPHVNSALEIANAMLGITGAVRTELLDYDMRIRIAGQGLEPFAGRHFRMEWWLAPMLATDLNATASRRELQFDRNSIDDAINLLKNGLAQFAPGGGDSPGFLGTLTGPIHDYCGTSGSLATDFPGILDDQGRIAAFLQAQAAAGMLRDDAQFVLQAMLACAMQSAHRVVVTLRQENFVLDRTFAGERMPNSSLLRQRVETKENNYRARAQAASGRAAQIEQILP